MIIQDNSLLSVKHDVPLSNLNTISESLEAAIDGCAKDRLNDSFKVYLTSKNSGLLLFPSTRILREVAKRSLLTKHQ